MSVSLLLLLSLAAEDETSKELQKLNIGPAPSKGGFDSVVFDVLDVHSSTSMPYAMHCGESWNTSANRGSIREEATVQLSIESPELYGGFLLLKAGRPSDTMSGWADR